MSDEKSNVDPAEGPDGESGDDFADPESSAAESSAPPAAVPEPPGPTHADWRQLTDEVRRLAAQIAHGRA